MQFIVLGPQETSRDSLKDNKAEERGFSDWNAPLKLRCRHRFTSPGPCAGLRERPSEHLLGLALAS